MRKKLVSGVVTMMAAVTLMASTVFAAPSVTSTQEVVSSEDTVKSDSPITVNGTTTTVTEAVKAGTIKLEFLAPTAAVFEEAGVESAVVSEITTANAEPAKIAEVLAKATGDTAIDKTALKLLTSIQELNFVDQSGKIVKGAKNVTVTWKAPITSGMNTGNVRVLHYSVARSTWELIKPEAINPTTGEITAFFEDLSPVSIVYVNDGTGSGTGSGSGSGTPAAPAGSGSGSGSSTGTSTPATGDSMNVAVYSIAALAALAGIVVVAKKRKTA